MKHGSLSALCLIAVATGLTACGGADEAPKGVGLPRDASEQGGAGAPSDESDQDSADEGGSGSSGSKGGDSDGEAGSGDTGSSDEDDGGLAAVTGASRRPRRSTSSAADLRWSRGIVVEHLETFLDEARSGHARRLPKYVERELRAYLGCGIHAHGLLRARCRHCGKRLLVALSCKKMLG